MKSLGLTLALAACGVSAGAQAPPMSWPPKVLYVERVESLPGQMGAYSKAAAAFMAIFAQAGSTGYCLGLSTVAGNEDEILLLFGYDSLKAMEQDQGVIGAAISKAFRQQASDLAASERAARRHQRALIAVYRPDISYRPDNVALDKVRYVYWNQHLVRFGGAAEYTADSKATAGILERASVDRHYWMYSVIAGAPTGTGLRIEPMQSLADLDLVNGPGLLAQLRPILDPEAIRALAGLGKDYVLQVAPTSDGAGSPEVKLFAVDPAISFVGREVAAAAPDFWLPPVDPRP